LAGLLEPQKSKLTQLLDRKIQLHQPDASSVCWKKAAFSRNNPNSAYWQKLPVSAGKSSSGLIGAIRIPNAGNEDYGTVVPPVFLVDLTAKKNVRGRPLQTL
jgi:hypothetical protein